jgi:hypothetical protein
MEIEDIEDNYSVERDLRTNEPKDHVDNTDNYKPVFTLSVDDEYTQPLTEVAGGSHVTLSDFNYSMNLIDKKVSTLYELCRYISSQQQENSKALKKLVALDELSEGFWNVSYLKYLRNILIFKFN